MKKLPNDKIPGALKMLRTIDADTSKQEVAAAFQGACAKILKKWREDSLAQKQGKSKSANNSANEFLRKNVYRLGNVLQDSDQLDAIRSFFPSEPKRRKGVPSLEENVFHWILVYIFQDNPDEIFLSVRNRIAKQLLYAQRHLIPSYLLVGFLYQVKGSENLTKHLEDERIREEWFARLYSAGKYRTLGEEDG